ncbi:hypothetical protein FG439_000233 [Yersinia enterocolitica]|nr:hypothetical protein [Yersinia enterocolitica]
MQENWQFWVTTVISVIALMTAASAKREAKKANVISKDTQKKNEMNQYYPSLRFHTDLVEGKFIFKILNSSQNRDAVLEKVRFNISINAEDHNYSKEEFILLDETLHSNNEKIILIDSLNKTIKFYHPILESMSDVKLDDSPIRIKAWLYFRPAIYQGETVNEYITATYSYKDGKFKFSGHIR